MLIGVDAANRTVCAALEQVRSAVAYAVWQTSCRSRWGVRESVHEG